MAYDEALADRIRTSLRGHAGVAEKKMFGGLCFMLHGTMCCGVAGHELMLRLGEDGTTGALTEPHVRPMDFTGKPLKTMVFVDPKGVADDTALQAWVERAAAFVQTLPKK